ncbi:MAG TPA: glutathione transferase GstA [Burkholderiales bacterium]|nr:glutathione transferase GstA [Burkholderiales bacterium]
MKLFYTPGACSLAVHIALRESGHAFELEKVDLKTKRTAKGQDYLRINPKGYVPALELDDGSILTEASVCTQYVADLAPQSELAPIAGSMGRYRLMEWMAFTSTEIHKNFSPLFDPSASTELQERQKKLLEKRFGYVAEHLAGRSGLMGEKLTAADAYLFTVLRWAIVVKMDLSRWPALQDYLRTTAEYPSVREALKAEGLER